MYLAEVAGLEANQLESCSTSELGFTAPRPPCSVLASERADIMPTVENAVGRYLEMMRS